MSDALFPDVDVRPARDGHDEAVPRVETARRDQIALHPCDLEALLPPEHAARLVWRFVEGLDLSAFYAAIRAREGRAGRPAIDPKILIAVWLYATMDGVGSAREVDRLCARHDAYRWLCGGVSVNYHTLSAFRVAHQGALDDLLTQSIATLRHRGVVTLARVAQAGTRVRGSAGAGSFRRQGTLETCLHEARQQVARTAKQTDGPGPARTAAAQARAAADRLARVEEALAQLPAVAAIKGKQGKEAGAARVSTTDPDARVMKMADGGFRPAYNVHLATDVDSRVIVGVRTLNTGSDQSQLGPMIDAVAQRLGAVPAAQLVEGGFVTKAAITAATARPAPAAGACGAGRRPAHARRLASRGRVAGAHGDRRGQGDLQSPRGDGRMGQRRRAHPPHAQSRAGPRADQGPHVGPVGRAAPQHDAHDEHRAAHDDLACAAGATAGASAAGPRRRTAMPPTPDHPCRGRAAPAWPAPRRALSLMLDWQFIHRL